jgi:hypothetical protein
MRMTLSLLDQNNFRSPGSVSVEVSGFDDMTLKEIEKYLAFTMKDVLAKLPDGLFVKEPTETR